MAWKKINEDGTLSDPPHNSGNKINVHLDADWLAKNGYTDMTDEQIAAYEAEHTVTVDRTALDAAYTNFRAVCSAIGTLIGNADFKGGFDEISSFADSEAAQSQAGIILSLKLTFADKQCTYEAAKLGIGQPQWWNECWNNQ